MAQPQVSEPSRVAPWASPRAQARLREVELGLADAAALGPDAVVRAVTDALAAHHRRYDEGIVLYAGTNVLTPAAHAAYDAAVSGRPSMGWPGEKYQPGLEHLDTLEVLTPILVADLMEGAYAEVRLQSATLANLAVYGALTRPGDTIAVLPEAASGHASHHQQGVPALRGLRVVDLPYDAAGLDVDHAALPAFLARERPRLVVVGASLMLFPHDVAAVRAAADDVGALVLYDASHVAGLVAARVFQRPLAEGAHVLTFSTYKSFGGPPGGCVVTRDADLAARISTTAYPGMLANYDVARLAPLAVTAAELAHRGVEYAEACRANASALARVLHEEGFAVIGAGRGFTASHHVAVDAAPFGGGDPASRRLADAGIFLSGIGLPDQRDYPGLKGIRIGTQEVTRRGFVPEDMPELAMLVRRVLREDDDPAAVRSDVLAVRARVDGRSSPRGRLAAG